MLDIRMNGGTEERRAAAWEVLDEAFGEHVGGYTIAMEWTEDGWSVPFAESRSGTFTSGDVVPPQKKTPIGKRVREELLAGGERVEGVCPDCSAVMRRDDGLPGFMCDTHKCASARGGGAWRDKVPSGGGSVLRLDYLGGMTVEANATRPVKTAVQYTVIGLPSDQGGIVRNWSAENGDSGRWGFSLNGAPLEGFYETAEKALAALKAEEESSRG